TVKNALRPILRQLNNGPVSMKLDQPPAIDEPQQTGAAGTVERTMPAAAEQANSVPTQCGGAFCPTTGGQELGAVRHELPPTVRRDVRWCAALAEMADALDPTGGNARCTFGGLFDFERGGLLLQEPKPFTRRSEPIANRSYTERLFCFFEHFRICDGLSATEQPRCACRSIELRYE